MRLRNLAGLGACGSSFSRAARSSWALNDSGRDRYCTAHSAVEDPEVERTGFLGIRKDEADSLLECLKAAGGKGKSFSSGKKDKSASPK